MKNIIISISLFAIMLVTIFLSLNYLNKTCSEIEKLSSSLESSIKNSNWDKAKKESVVLLNTWKKHADNLDIFVHHEEIDNVNTEIWKLTQYTNCENKDEALACIHVIKFYVNHINNFEKINIQNIF